LIEYGSRLDDETSRGLLRGIVDECDRLNRFTANLLELSRLQSGGTSLNGQVLSVNDLLRSVVKRLRSRTVDHEIQVAASQQDIFVTADTALFELALTNIIQNALLYSDAGSIVLIQSDRDRHSCMLAVTDQGCGIPEAEQSRVFERFYRVKRNEASPQGSGLGLAIAKGFVEAFDGSIDIASPVIGGQGTTVTIRLPIVEEAEA
jgi:two-component system sensor histidine kinase KdpD